ncbi:MAG: hypothetical protein ABIJ80_01410 [Patescibacteria group bacterium]
MTIQEMVEKLRGRVENDLSEDEIIELCFTVMQKHNNVVEQSRAAVILSGVVKKGLGKRVLQFLQENPELPRRVHEILNASITRMECF